MTPRFPGSLVPAPVPVPALVLVLVLVLAGTIGLARADDPMRSGQPITFAADEPAAPGELDATGDRDATADPDAAGIRGENAAPTPEPPRVKAPGVEPVPGPTNATRLQNSLPRGMRFGLKDDVGGRLEKQEDTVLGGKHFRIKTAQGAVHVWFPEDYDRETAGTVVYVHGYYTDADGAWREHGLARQFKASRQNAMFIVPDAPAGNDDHVRWPALTDLRRAVTRANIKMPDGPVIVIGHSGAFRTVMQWVNHRMVDKIILLDALYAGEAAFDQYIKTGKRAEDHRLIVVAASTAQGSKSFASRYKFAVARERMPDSVSGFSKHERSAKLLYIRSQYEHMGIVTSRKVIPMLLRVTPLKSL